VSLTAPGWTSTQEQVVLAARPLIGYVVVQPPIVLHFAIWRVVSPANQVVLQTCFCTAKAGRMLARVPKLAKQRAMTTTLRISNVLLG
jgi:hypothetical protein